jgi:RND superfamily putative drug exporter
MLAVLTWPVGYMKTGMTLIGSLAQDTPAAATFHRLQQNGIPRGISFPIYVMTHGGDASVGGALAIAKATPGVWSVIAPNTPSYRRGDDALIVVIPTDESSDDQGKATLVNLRSHLARLPGGAADVGGATAGDMAFTHAVYGSFPKMLLVVMLVTGIILLRALRSVVLAAKAVILNVVSLGAAFGFMVFFWQLGHGSQLFYGMGATGAIRAWIPTIAFASLFGLSMDYEVFVLSRIREEYSRTGSTSEAVVNGMAKTGRLVTCAALILVITFLSVSLDPNLIVRIQSTTLAFGVAVDALLIRSLLVPALVILMGRWNWWWPWDKAASATSHRDA